MSTVCVQGGARLAGEVTVHGAKNSALALLAASILSDEEVLLHNCPKISDVRNMCEILRAIGCRVSEQGDALSICSEGLNSNILPERYSRKIRSSVFLMGPLLARAGSTVVCQPGGCEIGARPIDLHINGLRKLGVRIREENCKLFCDVQDLRGAQIHLDYPSVGATENLMMTACLAKGCTVIQNAAREPEIVDLANMLQKMGARIRGTGSARIEIEGAARLHGVEYTCMPDRIEAGTFLLGAAMTQGDVCALDVQPGHLKALLDVAENMGAEVVRYGHAIRLAASRRLHAPEYMVETAPYPGFPTDLQPQLCAAMCVAEGHSRLQEAVFENRFAYLEQLRKMGADIRLEGNCACIQGCNELNGACVEIQDLRGGAALVSAALCARGKTELRGTQYIERGYENLFDELNTLGAEITLRG